MRTVFKWLRRYRKEGTVGCRIALLALADTLMRFLTRPAIRLSSGIGWEYVHIVIDDHSRVAFSTILPDETQWSACHALLQAVRYYRDQAIHLTRALTGNDTCYRSRSAACAGTWG